MAEELSEEEQLARMKSWWDENGTFVVVAVVLVVGVLAGWRWYQSYQSDQVAGAAALYAQYREAGESAQPGIAAQLADEFPDTAYHAFVLFDLAAKATRAGDLAAAEGHLVLVRDNSDPLIADLARVRLAKVLQGLDRSSEALAVLGTVTSTGYLAWALEVQGDIHSARGEVEQAHLAYQGALGALGEGEQRPVLEMKRDNTSAYQGEFVSLEDSLGDALREAEEKLSETETAQDASAQDESEAAGEALETEGNTEEAAATLEDTEE